MDLPTSQDPDDGEAESEGMSGMDLDGAVPAPSVSAGSGAATENAVIDIEAAKKAMEPEILAAFEQMSTEVLQSKDEILSGGYDNWHHYAGLTAHLNGRKCLHTPTELVRLAESVLVVRMARQARFLKELIAEHASVIFEQVLLADNEYRRWLETGDVSSRMPYNPSFRRHRGQVVQCSSTPEYDVESAYVESAYKLARGARRPEAGALLIENITLRWICELADVFSVPAVFFLEYLEVYYRISSDSYSGGGMRLDALSIRGDNGEQHIVIDYDEARHDAQLKASSFHLHGAFFLVLCTGTKFYDTGTKLIELAPGKRVGLTAVVSRPGRHIGVGILPALQTFYSDVENVHCLVKLRRHLPPNRGHWLSSRRREDLWKWRFVLSLSDELLRELASETQAMDYKLIELSSIEALDRIKSCRATVARIRGSNAEAFRRWRDPEIDEAYATLWKQTQSEAMRTVSDRDGSTALHLTARQLASESMQSECDWIEKRAADIMRQLNQNLQLVIAQLAVEDSAVSIKNGERSTQLTLLAAIYLPLTLATGIFGMNIKDIDSDVVRFWWVIIVSIVLMIPSGGVVAYIFWRSRKDKRKARAQAGYQKGDKLA